MIEYYFAIIRRGVNGQRETANISANIQGCSVKIEIKIVRDRHSEDQKKYQQSVEISESIYFIAPSFQQFYDWYFKTFGKVKLT